MAKITFNNKKGDFYPTLKTKVDAYFQETGKKKTGTWAIYHKAVVLFAILVACFGMVMFGDFSNGIKLLMCGIMGLTSASIGFNVMHDACHGSYTPNSKINDAMGLSLNVLGGIAYFWKQKHNIIHHTYTNVDGVDDDIAKLPTIRHCESQKWYPAHKVQHLYLPFLYMISSLFWIFFMDFQKYFKRKIYTTKAWKMDSKEKVIFWVTKIYYVAIWMILPISIFGFLPWLAGFMVMHAVMGFTLGVTFQLAHVVENTHFYEGYEDVKIDEEWAITQVLTTANFARRNPIVNWFVGGLNFQIEHHLFPRISHTHYPALSEIVKQHCEEYNVPYNDNPTMWGAVKSHFKMMRLFGKGPELTLSHS
jgi:linoleoyl-CoA desaturase